VNHLEPRPRHRNSLADTTRPDVSEAPASSRRGTASRPVAGAAARLAPQFSDGFCTPSPPLGGSSRHDTVAVINQLGQPFPAFVAAATGGDFTWWSKSFSGFIGSSG
jgi:hypothetical protein